MNILPIHRYRISDGHTFKKNQLYLGIFRQTQSHFYIGPSSPQRSGKAVMLSGPAYDGSLGTSVLSSPQHARLTNDARCRKTVDGYLVYGRRRANGFFPTPSSLTAGSVDFAPSQDVGATLVQQFVTKVTKPVTCLLPCPCIQKRRTKQLPLDFVPR